MTVSGCTAIKLPQGYVYEHENVCVGVWVWVPAKNLIRSYKIFLLGYGCVSVYMYNVAQSETFHTKYWLPSNDFTILALLKGHQ